MKGTNPRSVLHVLDTAEPGGAAICGIVRNLGEGVDPERYRIHACFLKPGPFQEQFSGLGIPSTCVYWKGNAKDLLGAARYASLLRSERFQIIHQHTGGRLMTGLGRRLTSARMVRTLHSRAAESTGVVPAECNLPERDALIAVSQAVAAFSQDPRAIVIYPGIDGALFSSERRAHEDVVIGTACRIEPVKGLPSLIEAIAKLAGEFPALRLEIAGDGTLRNFLEQECQRLGVSDCVSFLGWRQNLPEVMRGWDLFVLPSLDEAFPIAALEAMAAGLPVVASAVGGLPELVRDGETGWLVPANNPEELARRLRQLAGSAQARSAMGGAGRIRALREYSTTRMVEQTVAVYDELLAP
jgi:glycosyltransferase involved in cell wall biosynthesis